MFCHLRVASASCHWLLNLNIEHKLNPREFLIAFSEIAIVLIIVKVIEESNPLDVAALTKSKEQIWEDANTAHLDYLLTADCLDNNNQFVWRFWIERDFYLTLCLSSCVRDNKNILKLSAYTYVEAKLADLDWIL
jgi:hypothetical protein